MVQALIASRDGDVTRDVYRKPGTPSLPKQQQVVPTIYESMTGLLVSRSDRVDRYLRQYATYEPEDNQNKNTDLGKLWFSYWERSRAFRDWYKSTESAKGVAKLFAPAPWLLPTGRAGTDGSLTVQMVRPPNDTRKEKNRENRGADPFKYGSPGSGAPKP